MRINIWVLSVGGIGLLIALVYLLAGEITLGVAFAAAILTALAWQMRPLNYRGVAGGQVRSTARITTLRVAGLLLALICVFVLMMEGALEHWAHYRMGTVAIFALSGLMVLLALELRRQLDDLLDQLVGAEEEEHVQHQIDLLTDEGWLVLHNYDKPYGGNIDHIALGPDGLFAIETKSGRYRGGNAAQAIGSAMAVRELAGVSWVTAVVCTPHQVIPMKKGESWLVGRQQLADWLREARLHRGRPIDFEEARARLLGAATTS